MVLDNGHCEPERQQPKLVGKVRTVVSHLEMFAAPPTEDVPPPCTGIDIVRAQEPTLSFYRYLYGGVGGPWLWWRRRYMRDEELAPIIRDEAVDVRVMWVHGVPGGYFELDNRGGDNVELAYFGLMPEFIGRGLGRFLLDRAIRHAWQRPISRLWVHTCGLDHPRALGNYLRAGFELFKREEGHEFLLEGMTLPQHVADRSIDPP